MMVSSGARKGVLLSEVSPSKVEVPSERNSTARETD